MVIRVGLRVPAKPLRFELWGAHEDLSPLARALTMISKLGTSNSQNKGYMVYTGSGHRCGVVPYSTVVWWIASWADDEQYKGRTTSRGEVFLGWCGVRMNFILLLLWWLALFIEDLVLFPNIEREGIQQWPF